MIIGTITEHRLVKENLNKKYFINKFSYFFWRYSNKPCYQYS